MSNNEIQVKRKRLSKNIRSTIVDLGIRKSDVAYLIKNLMFNNDKNQLVKLIERDDIPIAVQIFAHALLDDYKKGNMNQAASMMQWAFDNTPEETQEDLSLLDEEALQKEIDKLLD